MSLFRNTPKIGETGTNVVQPRLSLNTASAASVNPLERPLVSGGGAGPIAEFSSVDVPRSSVPHTNSGEAVLTQALTALDNPTLLKVARSRGIDVTAEAQLKPGVADQRLIKKIINDFSDDELGEARNQGLEVSRNKPLSVEPGPNATKAEIKAHEDAQTEAWHLKVLSTFFPDVSVPKAMEARAMATIAKRPASTLSGRLGELGGGSVGAPATSQHSLGTPEPVKGIPGANDYPILRNGERVGRARIVVNGDEAEVGLVAPEGYKAGDEKLQIGSEDFRKLKAQFEKDNPGVKLKLSPGSATSERAEARAERRTTAAAAKTLTGRLSEVGDQGDLEDILQRSITEANARKAAKK
jgi:hypothetical protein